jgi:hypothetical protein
MDDSLYRRMVWKSHMVAFLPYWLFAILYRVRKHWGWTHPFDPRLPRGIWQNWTSTYVLKTDTRWSRLLRYLRSTPWLSPYKTP